MQHDEMQREELKEAIQFELNALNVVVSEVASLLTDVAGEEVSIRNRTAAGAFLAQFYTGIENILKRIVRYNGAVLPKSETWHLDLFRMFCSPSDGEVPVLFDEPLADALGAYRRFRHVVYHGYGFELDWSRMLEGLEKMPSIFAQVRMKIGKYLDEVIGAD